jgi:cytochrome c-type biogenesis protein CcmF
VLGDSSVHAFTDLGMQGQLVVYVLTFVLVCVALLIDNALIRVSYIILSLLLAYFAVLYNFKRDALFIWTALTIGLSIFSYVRYFPKEKDEEELFSREFWIFLGSLLLLLSSLIITYFTSIPVLNKLFDLKKAPLKIEDYNLWMVPFAILILLLIGSGLFLKFKKTDRKEFFRKLKYSAIISVVFGLACSIPLYLVKDFSKADGLGKWNLVSYSLLFISGIFAVTANLDYWLRMLKGKISKGGAAIAHIGFALIMVGALVSVSKKQTLSAQTPSNKVKQLGDEFNDQKSILLLKGDTVPMGPYLVSYAEKVRKGIDVYFKVNYFTLNKENKPELLFQLEPKMQENPRMGRAPEPGTRHYANRDVYTVVTAYPNFEEEIDEKNKEAYNKPKNYVAHLGDTIVASNAIVIIDSLKTNVSEEQYNESDSLLEVTAVLKAYDEYGRTYVAKPKYVIRNNSVVPQDDEIKALGLRFTFWKINPELGSIEITLSEKVGNTKDFIVMEAYLFPYINVLWLGCVVMAIGTIISIIERRRKLKLSQSKLGAE